MRLCRIAPTWPTDQRPGLGLPGYFQACHIHHESLIITGDQPGQPRSHPPHMQVKHIHYPDFAISNNHGVKKIVAWLVKLIGYTIFLVASIWPMVRFKPDIVHIHTPLPLFQGLFAHLILRSRVIIQFHGSDLLRVKKSRLIQHLLRYCDGILYVSRSMEADLSTFIPSDKLFYIPSGVDTSRFKPLHEPRQNQICMIGNLRWQKGYEYALEAFAHFLKHFPDWQLIIAGEGTDRHELESKINTLGIDQHVILLGMVDRERVVRLMNQSRIFMISSVSEGFPKVIIEAMACGTPIVSTEIGSCGEVVPGAGLVVPIRDAHALATALKQLASDSVLWQQYSDTAIERAQQYDWAYIAGRVENVYRQILSEAR